jgi:pyridoxal phosphate enzyme (YggS family)
VIASVTERLQANLQRVRERIGAAAARSNRPADSVRLIAVTKYVDAAKCRQLFALGCQELGESRPQVLWEKQFTVSDLPIRWHLVGPLQRNKIRRTLPLVSWIHSVDSFRLAQAIDRIALELDRTIDVLIEVNVSHEVSKQGLAIESVATEIEQIAGLAKLRVRGLMCMSGLHSNAAQKRHEFATLRELRDDLRRQLPADCEFNELSMGMSDDFELAIEEGATMVRLGSVLFEGI